MSDRTYSLSITLVKSFKTPFIRGLLLYTRVSNVLGAREPSENLARTSTSTSIVLLDALRLMPVTVELSYTCTPLPLWVYTTIGSSVYVWPWVISPFVCLISPLWTTRWRILLSGPPEPVLGDALLPLFLPS